MSVWPIDAMLEQYERKLWRQPMNMSESVKSIAPALVKAQKSVDAATKNKANPGFKGTRYADLPSVVEACQDALNAAGITFLQCPEPCEGGFLQLRTVLMHESGEWVSGTIKMPLAKLDPQGYGSAMTYARRYGLAAIIGVIQDDDDANAATPRAGVPTDDAGRPAQGNQPMTGGGKKASDLL